uniref:UPAR/Ly6 domain-containing protein n=1 Tax=Globodera pallida TaxID=36090 RepID=A0A183BYD5_GLOPA
MIVPSELASHESSDKIKLKECTAGVERCIKLTCTLDAKALNENAPGMPLPDDTRYTTTVKACMESEKTCEIPDKVEGIDNKAKKYCGMSCCTGYACNGTLGLRSFGTVAAMIAFVAAFFVRWN